MEKKNWLFISFLFFLQSAFAINPYIKNYSISEGLPSNKVFYACQDNDGFMWFGTDVGVIRFDGINMVHFKMSDGLSDNIIFRIKTDNSGRVWFMNLNGTVNYFYKNKIYNEKNDPLLKYLKSDFYFIDFFEDTDSTLYFYNSIAEIYVVKNNELFDYHNFKHINTKEIGGLHLLDKSSDGNFILWTSPGFYEMNSFDDEMKLKTTPDILLKSFKVNTDEYINFDRLKFLHLYKRDKRVKEKILQLETTSINEILIDSDSLLWLAIYDKGVYCYKNDSLLLHLDIEQVLNMVVDLENNIWISSEKNGIYKINRDILKYTFLGIQNFNETGITDLAPENDGGLLATNGSSLYLIRGKKSYNTNFKIDSKNLNNIFQLRNNTVIANGPGTEANVFTNFHFNKKTNSVSSDINGKLNYIFKKTTVDPSEKWILSYINDELIAINTEDNNYRGTFIPLREGRIRNIFYINTGDLIINSTTNYSITVDSTDIRKSIFGQSFLLNPLNGKNISSHLKLDNNNELFNILGNEIYLLNDSTFYEITKDLKSQIDYRIKNMAYDGSTLFFFTSRTVYFITNPQSVINGERLYLNRLNIEFNNINDIVCQDSTLYVASDGGIMFIPIKECVNAKVKLPEPYFYKVLLDDEDYDLNSGVVEFKNKKRLSIEFASLNYSSSPSSYSYMLEGIDENWIQGNESRVVYLNLPPGNFSFKLKARKGMEEFSNEIVLPVQINPTIFQRAIIKIFFLLIFLLGLFIIVWIIYTNQIKKKETDSLLITLEHKALQSMMNPHFIFNALGSIQRYLLQNNAEEAGTYLSKFARLIRQNMNSLKSNSINIDDEVERLRNYMDLEKFRMNNSFNYTIYIDENIDGDEISIPSMVVQPFVENAIWHGVSSFSKGGIISIWFNLQNEKSIDIIIEDNGVGIQNASGYSKSEHNLNMGVSITEKRLKLIGEKFGVESKIITEDINPGTQNPGTRIKLAVPILT